MGSRTWGQKLHAHLAHRPRSPGQDCGHCTCLHLGSHAGHSRSPQRQAGDTPEKDGQDHTSAEWPRGLPGQGRAGAPLEFPEGTAEILLEVPLSPAPRPRCSRAGGAGCPPREQVGGRGQLHSLLLGRHPTQGPPPMLQRIRVQLGAGPQGLDLGCPLPVTKSHCPWPRRGLSHPVGLEARMPRKTSSLGS